MPKYRSMVYIQCSMKSYQKKKLWSMAYSPIIFHFWPSLAKQRGDKW